MKKLKPREGDLLKVTFLVGNGTNVERDFSGIFFPLKTILPTKEINMSLESFHDLIPAYLPSFAS